MSSEPYPDRALCGNCLRHGERVMRPPNLSPCIVCLVRERCAQPVPYDYPQGKGTSGASAVQDKQGNE